MKKIFFILVFLSFCFLFSGNAVLAQGLEETYPQVPGAEAPTTVKAFLPEYIQYLFNFAIIVAGLIAFISLVYGGFRYLASAGNPTAMSDAKSQIAAGILGLVILVSSYVILIQINPELISLKIGKIEFEKGIILYADSGCPGGDTPLEGSEEGKDFLRVRASYSWFGDNFSNKARSMYVYDSSDELGIKIFRDRDYQDPFWKTADHEPYASGECFAIAADSESVQLIWKLPGVYLFTDTECKDEPHLFIASISDFAGIGLHDKAKSIKIIPGIEKQVECDVYNPNCFSFAPPINRCDEQQCQIETTKVVGKFGAVLHEHNNFHGDAEVFFGGTPDSEAFSCITLDDEANFGNGEGNPCRNDDMYASYCQGAVGKRASSITIFLQRPPGSPDPTGSVTLYEHVNFNDDEDGILHFFSIGDRPEWRGPADSNLFNPGNGQSPSRVSSIKIEGDYIVVLFREDGRGEVFRESDFRLKDNHIGNDQAKFMLVIPVIKRGI